MIRRMESLKNSKGIQKVDQLSSDGSQAGTVYDSGWVSPTIISGATDTPSDTLSKSYRHTDKISYCLDANYWKGTTIEYYLTKHKRQLVIEEWVNM